MTYKNIQLIDLLTPISKQIQPKDFGSKDYVGLEHLKSGDITLGEASIASQVKSTKWEFQSGDILYGKLRPYLNKCAVADRDGICSTDILVLRPNKNVDARYVAYCLSGNDFVEYSNSTVSGMNLPRTTWSKFNDYTLAVPVNANGELDIVEQKRIADNLDKIFIQVESGIEKISEQHHQTSALKQSLLADTFSNVEWRNVKISDIEPELIKGVNFDKSDATMERRDGYVPLLRAHNIKEMCINLDELMYVKKAVVKKEQYLKNGDVVFVTSSGSKHLVGKSALITNATEPITIGAFNSLLRFPSGIDPRYVFYSLNSPSFKLHIASRLAGANINNIKKGDILDFELAIPFKNENPDLDAQKKVADELDFTFRKAEELNGLFRVQKKSFLNLRSSVLRQSFQMKT